MFVPEDSALSADAYGWTLQHQRWACWGGGALSLMLLEVAPELPFIDLPQRFVPLLRSEHLHGGLPADPDPGAGDERTRLEVLVEQWLAESPRRAVVVQLNGVAPQVAWLQTQPGRFRTFEGDVFAIDGGPGDQGDRWTWWPIERRDTAVLIDGPIVEQLGAGGELDRDILHELASAAVALVFDAFDEQSFLLQPLAGRQPPAFVPERVAPASEPRPEPGAHPAITASDWQVCRVAGDLQARLERIHGMTVEGEATRGDEAAAGLAADFEAELRRRFSHDDACGRGRLPELLALQRLRAGLFAELIDQLGGDEPIQWQAEP